MTKKISPKRFNITKLNLIESLDLNFPVGLRRFAIGQEVENKIDKEWKIHKLLSKIQTIISLSLFGASVGVLFPHPWHFQYHCVIAALATILVVTIMYSRNRHTTISARLQARRSNLYADQAKTKVWKHINFIEPGLPKALLPLLKIPLIQDKLAYQRQLILQKILVGKFKANMVFCNSLKSILTQRVYGQQASNKQIATQNLYRYASKLFNAKCYEAVLVHSLLSTKKMSRSRKAICTAKIYCFDPEISQFNPYTRSQAIWQKVQNRLGNCYTSQQQIEDHIFKNTHSSLDAILNHYERLE